MAERGEVRAVAWMPLGSELSAAASIGALSLVVDNPVDFDEDGGTVDLNGVQYDYSTVDQDTGTLTLATALTVAGAAGDRLNVYSGGQVALDYVAFVSLGDGDEIEVPIPYGDRDLWPEGEYTNPVLVDLSDDLEAMIGVPGRTPVRDGSFINPATLPAPTIPASDGLAPSTAPTSLQVIGGIGALFMRWVPVTNKDPVTYDLHVSPTSGFTPDATTLAVSTAASSHTLRQLPTGVGTPPDTTLKYGVTYYAKVLARDVDGSGPLSTEASGAMVQVTGPDVAAESVTADHIVTGTLTGDLFSGDIVLGSTISTGQIDPVTGTVVGARVELGPDGITNYATDGHKVVSFPLDGTNAYVEADLALLSANVRDHFTLYGVNNAVAASASILLASGVQAPQSPPTLSQAWDTVQLDTNTVFTNTNTDTNFNLGSFKLDPSQITSMCWDQVYNCWQVIQQRSNGFRFWRFNPDGSFRQTPLATGPWIDDYRNQFKAKVCRSGWLMYFQNTTWYVWDTVVGGGRWGIIPNGWIINDQQDPFIAFDEGAQQFMLVQNALGNTPKTAQVRRFHTVPYVGGAIQSTVSDSVTTLPSGMGRTYPWNGMYYGSADFGGARYAGTINSTTVFVCTASAMQNGAANYQQWPTNGNVMGFHYDGTNFWTVDATGLMTKYTGWTWATEPSTTWVGISAYDSDATGGTHETPVGSLASRQASRRSKLVITVPPTQDAGGTDDPDQWRVYWARTGGATPTKTDMHLVAGIGSPSASTTTTMLLDSSGANPPGGIFGQSGTSNTFPSGNPAAILDGSGNTMIDAQGHGSVGMVGEVRMYAANTPPTGWLVCDGRDVSRTTYAALYAVIGVAFGAGNGTTTFNLPDMRSRMPIGVGAIMPTIGGTEAGAPPPAQVGSPAAEGTSRSARWAHVHSHNAGGLVNSSQDLNLQTNTNNTGTANRITQQTHSHTITGATGDASAVSGGAGTVPSVHASQALNFIIRY